MFSCANTSQAVFLYTKSILFTYHLHFTMLSYSLDFQMKTHNDNSSPFQTTEMWIFRQNQPLNRDILFQKSFGLYAKFETPGENHKRKYDVLLINMEQCILISVLSCSCEFVFIIVFDCWNSAKLLNCLAIVVGCRNWRQLKTMKQTPLKFTEQKVKSKVEMLANQITASASSLYPA